MNKRRLRVRLRTRIIVWFVSLVVLQGVLVNLSVVYFVHAELERGARQNAQSMAHRLLLQSMNAVLTGNPVELHRLLQNVRHSTPALRYAFVLGPKGDVLAHTFPTGVPTVLLGVHPFARESRPTLVRYGDDSVYDVAAVADWGSVRVGVSLSSVEATVSRLQIYVLLATAAAVLATFGLALIVSRPVELLSRFVASATAAASRDMDPEVLSTLETSELCAAFESVMAELRTKMRELTDSEDTIRGQKEYIENLHTNLGLAICVLARDGSVEFANERARSRLGAQPEGSAEWMERLIALDEAQAPLRECVARGAPFQGLWRADDGTVYDIKGVTVRDHRGSESILLRFLDVSEEIALREQLERSEKMAYVGSLAASIAHGVNNPLGAAIMKAEMLIADAKQAGLPRHHIEDLEKVRTLAIRAGQLTQRLLLFSRHSAEDFPLHTRPTDIVALTRQVVSHLEEKAKMANALLTVEDGENRLMANVDAEGIRHVVENILDNAIDAVGPGGVVQVSVTAEDRTDGRCVLIRVRDDGPGMSEDTIAKAFTPFFTTKDIVGGTGLGLAISDRIVNQHGGRIGIRSQLGRGTTVTVVLPIHAENAEGT